MRRFPRYAYAFAGLAALLWAATVASEGTRAPASDPATGASGASGGGAQRVVSINPSLTAMLLALGAGDRLVGVDDFSADSEPAVAALPRVGGLYDSSVEAVAALRPDLVVLVPSIQQEGFRAQLATLGVPVRSFNPRSFEDVLATLKALGAAVGRTPAAEARIAAIEAARRAVAPPAGRPSVRTILVLQRDPLFVVGRGSFIDDMLGLVGARNLAAPLDEGYPRASLEWLLAARPDVLLDATRDPEPAADYWRRWPSLGEARVVTLPPGEATLPGPHLDRALHVLAEAVHAPAPAPEEGGR